MSALGSEQPGPQHLVSRKCGRPGVHPEAVWESAQLAPVALSLGSSPEASGRSLQVSPLQDPEQPGLQRHISRSCKRQEGHPGGRLGGVSVLWCVQQALAGAFKYLLQDLNSLGQSTQSPGSATGLVCTQKQTGSAQLAPA